MNTRPAQFLTAAPGRIACALLLALALAGCGPAQVVVEVDGVALGTMGQLRLCGVMVPMDPAGDKLTAKAPACKGQGDLVVTAPQAQFIVCHLGAVKSGRNRTFRFKIANGQCVAA